MASVETFFIGVMSTMVKVNCGCGKVDCFERWKKGLFFNFFGFLEVKNDVCWALHLPNRVCFTSGLSPYPEKNRSGWRGRLKCEL